MISHHSKFHNLSFNIDTNLARLENGYAAQSHPAWRTPERARLLTSTLGQLIDSKRPDVIHIQECRECKSDTGESIDSVNPLKASLEAKGYETLVASYNDGGGDRAFKYITAYDPAVLTLQESKVKYFTKTPDAPTERPENLDKDAEARIKQNNFGQFWERGVCISKFSHIHLKESIYSINVHVDIPIEHRLKASELLVQWVRDIVSKEPDAKIVMSGDFNVFPEVGRGGDEQMAIINNAAVDGLPLLDEASKNLKLPNGESAESSFFAFPYDFIGVDNKSTSIHGTELAELIAHLPEEHRAHAEKGLATATSGQFDLSRFLSALEPTCRKQLIGLIYGKCRAIGGKLDRSFTRGFEVKSCKIFPSVQYDFPAEGSFNDEATVKGFVLQHHGDGPAFSSDHQPMMTSLRFMPTK